MRSLDCGIPYVLPIRDRADVIHRLLDERLGTLLPRIMRETGFDMWLVICQEDDLDPVFQTLIPMDTWCPILQILVFVDGGEPGDLECLNLSMTNTRGLYHKPWSGRHQEEQ